MKTLSMQHIYKKYENADNYTVTDFNLEKKKWSLLFLSVLQAVENRLP